MTDTTAPFLSALALPTAIDLTATNPVVSFQLAASGDASGLAAAVIFLDQPISVKDDAGGVSLQQAFALRRTLDGSFAVSETLSQLASAGIYTVAKIQLLDNAGNRRDYSAADLQSLGFASTFELDTPPTVVPSSVSVSRGQSLAAASLFSAADADGDSITRFQFWDSTPDPASGHLVVDGLAQAAGMAIEVTAAQLTVTSFQSGSGTDKLWVRAFDGALWGAWQPFAVTAPVEQPPVVTVASAGTPADHDQAIAASSLFSAADADGDSITQYALWDSEGNGRWVVLGGAEPAAREIDIPAAELANTVYQAGFGIDHLYVRAFDGIAWSDWTPAFTVTAPANHAPVVTPLQASTTATHHQIFAATSLFSASDADSDAIATYALWDTEGNGHWVVNGTVLAANTEIDVAAANLSQISYIAGEGTDHLYARANDGTTWGGWTAFTVTGPVDQPPVVTANNVAVFPDDNIPASRLFSVFDADGDAIAKYQFWDSTAGPGSSHWVVDGVAQANRTTVEINADQLANTSFQPADPLHVSSDVEWVRAFDGARWSAWQSFNVIEPHPLVAPDPRAPEASGTNYSASHGENIAASTLFSASDADGDQIVRYEVWDSTVAPNSGHWVLNGVATQSNVAIEVTATQLANTFFQSGSGADDLFVRAYDGELWSPWTEFHVTAPPDQPPAVTAANLQTLANQTLAAANLFGVSDGEGDSISRYAFWDVQGHGYFTFDGVTQPTNAEIDVAAADLPRLNYVAGSATDQLYVRAFDGMAWSGWHEFDASAGPATVAAGGSLELGSAASNAIVFAGSSGTLRLDDPASFAGTVAGMTGSDAIDFGNIGFGTVQTPDFTGSAFDGTLTVTDGVHTDHVTLLGDYRGSSFVTATDGHGGTLVVDPPRG